MKRIGYFLGMAAIALSAFAFTATPSQAQSTTYIGERASPMYGDQPTSVEVVRVTVDPYSATVYVTTRYNYRHFDSYYYRYEAYYVEHSSPAQYDSFYGYWYVDVNGDRYPLAFSGDNSYGWNSSHIIQVPSQFARPTYVVPSDNGGPPAVIPGRGPSSGPELNIPDSRPSTAPDPIPGCIPGLPCGGAAQAPEPPAPRSGCIPGIPC
jgi:hypothetical protein